MSSPAEKLAASLEHLRALQKRGRVAIRGVDLSRTHRERLLANGFLREVVKGWYIAARPDQDTGESTTWFTSFWGFCADYLSVRLGDEWCLSAEQSIKLHVGNLSVPEQLVVRSPRARNQVTQLIHDTSVLDYQATLPSPDQRKQLDGLQVYRVATALLACPERVFRDNPIDMRSALSMIATPSVLLEPLLEGGHSTIAGRIAGALRNIGRSSDADDILKTMQAAGYNVRERDPFADSPAPNIDVRETSPHVYRLGALWQSMREGVLGVFPPPPSTSSDQASILEDMDRRYVEDAYHSMSIEGYEVSRELIEDIRRGSWDPDGDESHRSHRAAMAAQGYWLATKAVRTSVKAILLGSPPAQTVSQDHSTWFRELFRPLVTAGLMRPGELAGYRRIPVYIRQSRHVPPRYDALGDLMHAFFDLLEQEDEPSVRVVLGHYAFVFIHPYADGNGRLGRFLMNTMLVAGGYRWAVIPVERRKEYMSALERASVHQDIEPFASFLGGLVRSVDG